MPAVVLVFNLNFTATNYLLMINLTVNGQTTVLMPILICPCFGANKPSGTC